MTCILNHYDVHLDDVIDDTVINVNITNGALKTIDCLNGRNLKEVNVKGCCINDYEYINITADKFIISENLYVELTFKHCNIKELDVSNNKRLSNIEFIDCNIEHLNVSDCCLKELINLPTALKTLNANNNNLLLLNLDKNNLQKLDIQNNKQLIIDKNNLNSKIVLYDSDEEELLDDEFDTFMNLDDAEFEFNDTLKKNTSFLDSYYSNNITGMHNRPCYSNNIKNYFKETEEEKTYKKVEINYFITI